jgi:hypothetical protein
MKGGPPGPARYRGTENHVYRIEVHSSGDTADASRASTFKWSGEGFRAAAGAEVPAGVPDS